MTYEDARLKEIAECECRYQRRVRRLFGAAVLAGAFVSRCGWKVSYTQYQIETAEVTRSDICKRG